jgi:hypothetical protein
MNEHRRPHARGNRPRAARAREQLAKSFRRRAAAACHTMLCRSCLTVKLPCWTWVLNENSRLDERTPNRRPQLPVRSSPPLLCSLTVRSRPRRCYRHSRLKSRAAKWHGRSDRQAAAAGQHGAATCGWNRWSFVLLCNDSETSFLRTRDSSCGARAAHRVRDHSHVQTLLELQLAHVHTTKKPAANTTAPMRTLRCHVRTRGPTNHCIDPVVILVLPRAHILNSSQDDAVGARSLTGGRGGGGSRVEENKP